MGTQWGKEYKDIQMFVYYSIRHVQFEAFYAGDRMNSPDFPSNPLRYCEIHVLHRSTIMGHVGALFPPSSHDRKASE